MRATMGREVRTAAIMYKEVSMRVPRQLIAVQQLSVGDNSRKCAAMANEARTADVAHEAIARVSSQLLSSS